MLPNGIIKSIYAHTSYMYGQLLTIHRYLKKTHIIFYILY